MRPSTHRQNVRAARRRNERGQHENFASLQPGQWCHAQLAAAILDDFWDIATNPAWHDSGADWGKRGGGGKNAQPMDVKRVSARYVLNKKSELVGIGRD